MDSAETPAATDAEIDRLRAQVAELSSANDELARRVRDVEERYGVLYRSVSEHANGLLADNHPLA